jgi:DNA polymerase bacteriophage-type
LTRLSIDIETFSPVDLTKCGVHKYAEEVDILMIAYAFGDDPSTVSIIDLKQGEGLPAQFFTDLFDPTIIKTAFNANFEITCMNSFFEIHLDPRQWRCTQAHALYMGLPISLEKVAEVLNITQQKDKAGKDLINFFCKPCKPTKTNKGRERNLPEHNIEKWDLFKKYCMQDVRAEMGVRKILEKFPIHPQEHDLWVLDHQINNRGARVDMNLVQRAIDFDSTFQNRAMDEIIRILKPDPDTSPKSLDQLKKWLKNEEGLTVESLTKKDMPEVKGLVESVNAKRILELRQDLGKTSVAKYEAMFRSAGTDNRVRGLFQYYGANRTGRWAGRIVQVQNLPKNFMSDLGDARKLVSKGDFETFDMLYWVPGALSELIRTAFIPAEGCTFVVSDFSAIEARVIAWLAGEQWRLDVFNGHGKIYEASAAAMFKIPIEDVDKAMRQKGKVAELALGYQGGAGALINMGALDMGLKEDELPGLVHAWREANPRIAKLWYDIQDAAVAAINEGKKMEVGGKVKFYVQSGALFVELPSGRRLAYVKPRVKVEGWKKSITYEEMDHQTKRWSEEKTYGGKLVENIVQAIARDCLAESMLRLDSAGFKIVMHIHDEVVIEAEGDSLKEVSDIMGQPIDWAPGLPLRADGFTCSFYKKDG